jgi:hypothetical protein
MECSCFRVQADFALILPPGEYDNLFPREIGGSLGSDCDKIEEGRARLAGGREQARRVKPQSGFGNRRRIETREEKNTCFRSRTV